MIITCNNCNKKFNIESSLIPNKGRLLQCASCNHKWFFKKEILENIVSPMVVDIDSDNVNVFDQNDPSNKEEINPSGLSNEEAEAHTEKGLEADTVEELDKKIEINNEAELKKKIEVNTNKDIPVTTKQKKPKNFKILNSVIVAIFSFVAFIIFVDTFKYPIGKIVPNIEFILYNLYESIKDISLFISDLT